MTAPLFAAAAFAIGTKEEPLGEGIVKLLAEILTSLARQLAHSLPTGRACQGFKHDSYASVQS